MIPETRERCLEEFSEFSCVLKTVFYRWRNKLGKVRSFLRGKQAIGTVRGSLLTVVPSWGLRRVVWRRMGRGKPPGAAASQPLRLPLQ